MCSLYIDFGFGFCIFTSLYYALPCTVLPILYPPLYRLLYSVSRAFFAGFLMLFFGFLTLKNSPVVWSQITEGLQPRVIIRSFYFPALADGRGKR